MMSHRFLAWSVGLAAVVSLFVAAGPAAAANPQINFTSSEGPIILSAGANWFVTATGTVVGTGLADCNLLSNGNNVLDEVSWQFSASDPLRQYASFMLTATHTDASDWQASVLCEGTGVEDANVSISAVKLTSSGNGVAKSYMNDASQYFHGTTFHTVASLALTKGKWWLVGKTNLTDNDISHTENVTCRILITPDKDQTTQGLYYIGQAGVDGEASVQLAHVFSGSSTAKLQCVDPKGHAVSADHVRFVAYKLGRLTRIPYGGSPSTSGAGTATPAMITTYRNASVNLGTVDAPLLTMANIPPGSWLVTAKAVTKDSTAVKVDCTLHASAASNEMITYGAPAGHQSGMYFQAWFFSSGASTASLSCSAGSSGPSISYIRITALQAANA